MIVINDPKIKSCIMILFVVSLLLLPGCKTSEENPEEMTEVSTEEVVAADEDDWDYIKQKGNLVIGFVEFAPMNYYDDKGEFVGFDTEVAETVCERLGIDAVFVPINWDNYSIELQTKNIDCVWNAMCITKERSEELSMTEGYLYDTQTMVVRREEKDTILNDNAGYVVTAEEGSIAESKLDGSTPETEGTISAYDYFYDDTYVPSITMSDALEAVRNGDADIALIDSSLALRQCAEGGDYSDLCAVSEVDFGQDMYGVGFRKNSNAAAKISKELKKLYKDGTMKEIASKYGLESELIDNE